MSKALNRLTDWLYARTVATIIDYVFVAKYPITYAEVVEFDPDVSSSYVVCGLCTVLRTIGVLGGLIGFIWWVS